MPIDDATNESYTTEALSYSSGPYYYYCKVTSSLNGSTAVSDVFTVTVDINPESIAVGTGAFIGRNCFDVAMQNNNAACGLLSNRAAIKTLFTNREKQSVTAAAPYSGVQEYVFSPSSGTVSNVRFISVEESGSSIESLTPQADYSGGDVSIASVVVAYKSTLNTDLAGKIRSDGNKVKLYVIYNDASNGTGTDKRLSLNISLQDYVCCDGAWIENGAWDYADGTPGDWAKDINWSNINDYYNQAGTPNPKTGLSGVYNNTTAFNSYFKSSASGGLCWYKKEMLESHMTWPNAISKCADDTWTDGKDTAVGGWYLPNLKELDYLYRNLPDGSLGGKRVGSAEFFGGSDGARPLYISLEVPFWSSTESDATNVYTLYFGNGERKILNKRTPTSFFPGVTRCVRRF
jgi:hypothetical protein